MAKQDGGGKNLIRVFVAIEMPASVIDEIRTIQDELKKKNLFDGSYINPDDAHLTLQFIGYIEPIALPPIKKLLSSIEFKPIKATLGKVGFFGTNGFVKIIWLEILGAGLTELAHSIEKTLSIGTVALHREFQAHVTLARVKKSGDGEELKKVIKGITVNTVDFNVDAFVLKQSTLTSDGPVYVDLHKYEAK